MARRRTTSSTAASRPIRSPTASMSSSKDDSAATTPSAKCASRYENAPEKYKNTPGYKKAEEKVVSS